MHSNALKRAKHSKQCFARVRRIIQKAIHEAGRVYDMKVDVIRDTLDEATKVEFDLLMPTEVSMRPYIYI